MGIFPQSHVLSSIFPFCCWGGETIAGGTHPKRHHKLFSVNPSNQSLFDIFFHIQPCILLLFAPPLLFSSRTLSLSHLFSFVFPFLSQRFFFALALLFSFVFHQPFALLQVHFSFSLILFFLLVSFLSSSIISNRIIPPIFLTERERHFSNFLSLFHLPSQLSFQQLG